MKFATYSIGDGSRAAVIQEGLVYDLQKLDPTFPSDLNDIFGVDITVLAKVVARADRAQGVAIADVQLVAPFPKPKRNIFCVGKNYHEHAHEFHSSGFDSTAGKDAIPEFPIIFTKAPTSIVGPGAAVISSYDETGSVDYEGELGVIIGRGGRSITRSDAYDHVFGYTVVNDVTSRILQQRHKQWFLGKSIDTFCPMGPILVTADELGDIREQTITTTVNGDTRQEAVIGQLIFDIPSLIETISKSVTLEPGDIIATGTPSGVGIGFNPPKYLQKGDEVIVTVSGIGALRNIVA